jgi:signal-transduction protein with cAMP-binding, CBS, and nucleotidyltransferase domain
MAQSIREVMTANPISIPQSASVQEAAQAMSDSDIGDVIVLDDDEKICGIVTDRDIATRVAAEGKDPSETLLGEICSRDVQALSPDDSVGEAVRLMSDKAVRRLPVLENGSPVGIVSLGDLAATEDPESALADISAAAPSN